MPYTILSLSGGGMRGIFQAVCLRTIARLIHPKRLSDCFDMIAGTSTGSIIAFGVALNVDLDRVITLFEKQGPKIFASRFGAAFRQGPRYSAKELRQAIDGVFGTTKLEHCEPKIVIPATTLDRFRIRIFTNLERKPKALDGQLQVADVIMASCAAPTYFPPAKPAIEARSYVDGGMWANSPSLTAVMEAHAHAGVPFSDIRLVTIGNGMFPEGALAQEFVKLRTASLKMVSTLSNMFFATQNDMAEDFLEKLIGANSSLNLNTQLPKVIDLADAATAIKMLPPLAESEASIRFPVLEPFLKPQTVYFDATNRDFRAGIHFEAGQDAKGKGYVAKELAAVVWKDSALHIQRLRREYRFIIGVRKYENTAPAPDKHIPPNNSTDLAGQYVRYFRCEFTAKVEGDAHNVVVRLRGADSGWLRTGPQPNSPNAERAFPISSHEWSLQSFKLGPVRADVPCYLSVEIGNGPAEDRSALLLKDLRIVEIHGYHLPSASTAAARV